MSSWFSYNDRAASSPPYSVLSKVYDEVMDEVNYEAWADFIDTLIQTHHPDPRYLLELACGTGTAAYYLDELECYEILATDASEEMIRAAREKYGSGFPYLNFRVMNFNRIDLDQRFDVVFSLFDSINYLHHQRQLLRLFEDLGKVMQPGGLFIFDFTTPKNSREAVRTLDKESGQTEDGITFHRESRFDEERSVHLNRFTIKEWDTSKKDYNIWEEVHEQRIYSLAEMLEVVEQSPLQLLAKYSGFELVDADNNSLRITMVLQWPKTPSLN